MTDNMLFDEWPERYNQWFTTPIGELVREYEADLIHKLLQLSPGEKILDAGCGTGVFTLDFLTQGAEVVGLDISAPMLKFAEKKAEGYSFSVVQGDMIYLPFKDNSFDHTVSITALEFIEDAQTAINELFRVTKPGGQVVVATLNGLSPWAERRREKTLKGQKHVLENAYYRSPDELLAFSGLKGTARTVVHFQKDESPVEASKIEKLGQSQNLKTGAFAAVRWVKTGIKR